MRSGRRSRVDHRRAPRSGATVRSREPRPHPARSGPRRRAGPTVAATPGAGPPFGRRADRRRCSQVPALRSRRSARTSRGPPTAGTGPLFGGCGPPTRLPSAASGAIAGIGPLPLRPLAKDPLCGAWPPTAGNDRWSARPHRPGTARSAASLPPTAGNDPLFGAPGPPAVRAGRCRRGRAASGGPRPPTALGPPSAARRVPAAPADGPVRAGGGVATAGGARPRARVLGGAPAGPATGRRAVAVRGEQLRDGALTGVIGLRAHRVHRAPDDVKRPGPCRESCAERSLRAVPSNEPRRRTITFPAVPTRRAYAAAPITRPVPSGWSCPHAHRVVHRRAPDGGSAVPTSRIVVASSAARAGARRPAVIDVARPVPVPSPRVHTTQNEESHRGRGPHRRRDPHGVRQGRCPPHPARGQDPRRPLRARHRPAAPRPARAGVQAHRARAGPQRRPHDQHRGHARSWR